MNLEEQFNKVKGRIFIPAFFIFIATLIAKFAFPGKAQFDLFIISTLMTLAILFVIGSNMYKARESDTPIQKLILRFYFLGFGLMCIGILFKLMFWPGDFMPMTLGLASSLIGYVYYQMKDSQNKYFTENKIICTVLLVLGLVFKTTSDKDLFLFLNRDQVELCSIVKTKQIENKIDLIELKRQYNQTKNQKDSL